MDFLKGLVKQQNYDISSDNDDERQVGLNRGGAVQVNSREALVDQWARAGRVFIYHNPIIGTPETMSANGTTVTLTAPSVRFTVPAGTIVVPIDFQARVATVIAKSDIFTVIATGSDSYTSGGEALTPLNAYIDAGTSLTPSAVTNIHNSDTAIVEAALVSPRLLKSQKRQGQAAELATTWNPEYNILKGDKMVYMKGPASFLVFVVQETTAAEAEFSGSYAVLRVGEVG